MASTPRSRRERTRATPEVPSTSGVSPGRSVRSPSPIRTTRQEEKNELQGLNDRLAAYIDKVRYLESENSRLTVQVRSSEDTVTREITSIKALYEAELADARRVLDETAKEKAKLQIDVGKYKADADEWKAKYWKRDREFRDAETLANNLEKNSADLQKQAADAEAQRRQLEKERNKLRGEVADLQRQWENTRKQLEDETLLRVDLQNRLQSLKEELVFKDQVHEQEMNETRTRTTTEIEEVDSAARADYESQLQDTLQRLREEQDEQLREVRQEVEDLYKTKVDDLRSALNRSINSDSMSVKDLQSTRKHVDKLTSEVSKLNGMNSTLEKRVAELEAQIERERDENLEKLGSKDKEIDDLRASLEEQTQEYADLLDIRIKLDNEIKAYRELLEGEEERLNLSQSSTPPRTGRGQKRKRVSLSDTVQEFEDRSSASGSVAIDEVNTDGKYIKLLNTSDEDITIGNWQLKLRHSEAAGADDVSQYKFHHSLILRAGQYCTVWSTDTGVTHSPPNDLVMRGTKWVPNPDCMVAVLLDSDKQEAARRSSVRTTQQAATSTFRQRARQSGTDDVDAGRSGDGRCAVM